MEQRAFKNVYNCLDTNIYSYLEIIYTECRKETGYADCHYADRHYPECCGAILSKDDLS